MRLLLNAALALLLPVSAHAARAVMENIAASNNTVFVDTQTKRVHLSTQAYGDGVPTVSLYTTSNVVVGDNNACVLYATGTAACKSFVGSIDYSTITAALNAKISSVTVNASLLNPEASASLPLRVNSSSVAVKNAGNFVLNSEIDASSVAKLSSGLIPNWLVDASSVAKYNSSKQIHNYQIDASSVVKFNSGNLIHNYQIDSSSVNKRIGMSSACASGAYVDNATLANGVVTGGVCTSISGGSGDTTNSGYAAMSGSNTWVSGSTVTITTGSYANVAIWISSGSNASVKIPSMTVQISDYTSNVASATWRIDYQCFVTSAVIISGTFNNDKSADVYSEFVSRITVGGTASGSGSASSAECGQFTHLAVGANTHLRGSVNFETIFMGPVNSVSYEGWVHAEDSAETGSEFKNQYNGVYENPNGTAITRFDLTGHAGACTANVAPVGNFYCRWDLWRLRSWR
jgi:hypothetical protein